MTITQAFKHLIDNWEKQPEDFQHKYRMYKSRYLNRSGKHKKKVGESKMRTLLIESGYKEVWKKINEKYIENN